MEGATGMLLNVTGPEDLGLFEVNEAAQLVQAEADDNANIIFGSVVDQSMKDEVRVTVIATGFEGFELLARSPQRVRLRYESRPRVSAEDTDIRKLRVSDDDIEVPGFLKESRRRPFRGVDCPVPSRPSRSCGRHRTSLVEHPARGIRG
jgi:cell division protein FtsZ